MDLNGYAFLKHGRNTQLGRQIQANIVAGLNDPPIDPPFAHYPARTAMSRAATKLLNQLKMWRIARADELNIDPSLVWSMASLKRISRCPDSFHVEQHDSEIRRWQRGMFALEVQSYLP